MARPGKRGRKATPKPSAAANTTSTPSWKPAKASTTGNYGKAVSAAAHARNAARKAGPAVKAPGANGLGTRVPARANSTSTSTPPASTLPKPVSIDTRKKRATRRGPRSLD